MTNNYVLTSSGEFLCKDGHFSSFPLFGTYPFCVKVYKTTGHALNRAKKLSLSSRFSDYKLMVMTVDLDKVEKIGSENFHMDGFCMSVNNNRKYFTELMDEYKRGVNNQFPVIFSIV